MLDGYIHGFLADDEKSVFENGKRILQKLPKVVYVEFKNKKNKPCDWRIDGMIKNSIYPIVPRSREWYLDKGKKYPQLKIKRRQLPLALAFGMTSHSAQGQTFSTVL